MINAFIKNIYYFNYSRPILLIKIARKPLDSYLTTQEIILMKSKIILMSAMLQIL